MFYRTPFVFLVPGSSTFGGVNGIIWAQYKTYRKRFLYFQNNGSYHFILLPTFSKFILKMYEAHLKNEILLNNLNGF